MNSEKWRKLSQEEQNQFIHEKAGKILWLLWKGGLYYRANMSGYTAEISAAGRYTEEVAKRHAFGTSGEVKAIPEPTPDYVGSLDVIEEIYEDLAAKNWDFKDKFYCALGMIICGEKSNANDWNNQIDYFIHAPSIQRAEAIALCLEPEEKP